MYVSNVNETTAKFPTKDHNEYISTVNEIFIEPGRLKN